jgi:hypothetical protein
MPSIVEEPMACCGLMEAYDFDAFGDQLDFDRVIAEQDNLSRACCLITLSSRQKDAVELAKKNGFEVIHQFYNPRSFNNCFIMARTVS